MYISQLHTSQLGRLPNLLLSYVKEFQYEISTKIIFLHVYVHIDITASSSFFLEDLNLMPSEVQSYQNHKVVIKGKLFHTASF